MNRRRTMLITAKQEEYAHDFARIDAIMRQNGIVQNEATGLSYFSGYPNRTLYDWDLYFESIVQLYLGWNGDLIRNGVTLFLDQQREDGFIPRTVPPRPAEREGGEHCKPFLCQTIVLLFKRERDLSWLSAPLYERLKAYLTYWLTTKTTADQGLAIWNSAPHTGMDNHVERAGWWRDNFCMGVDLNSYLVRECRAFAGLAELQGYHADAEAMRRSAKRLGEAVQARLWNAQSGFFFDRHAATGAPILIKAVSGFAPLWTGIATPEQAARMVTEHLMNPAEFWRPLPVAGYAADQAAFRVRSEGANWKDKAWVSANYMVFQGLRRYGYDDLAELLAEKTAAMVRGIGHYEYFSSEAPQGCGLHPFWGWTLLAYFTPIEAATGYDPTALDSSFYDLINGSVVKQPQSSTIENLERVAQQEHTT